MATETKTPEAAETTQTAPAKEKTDTRYTRMKAAGKAALKAHKLKSVWVTTDEQVFPQRGDAVAHAKELGNEITITVTDK